MNEQIDSEEESSLMIEYMNNSGSNLDEVESPNTFLPTAKGAWIKPLIQILGEQRE